MNETQALNWARVAYAVATRSASRMLRDDLVQSALLAILEDPSDDLLDKVWDVREGMRNPLRRIARDRATEDVADHEDGDIPWLSNTPHESWLQMLDEEDRLTRRIREAYDDPEEAIAASASAGYYSMEVDARMAEEPLVDPRWEQPIYMQPEHRLDWGEVDIALEKFKPGWVGQELIYWEDFVYHGERKAVERYLRTLGGDAINFAFFERLSPVEAAVFATSVAGMVADVAPKGNKGRYYNRVREGAGDFMALANKGREEIPGLAWVHHKGLGIIPGDAELVEEHPGACSNYAIDDEEVWMWLFPDGPGRKRYSLPRGSDDDIAKLVSCIGARTQPHDISWDEEYTGWQLWDTKEARQAHALAALNLLPWEACARIGRQAFWDRPDCRQLLARNYHALHAGNLGRDDDYQVVQGVTQAPPQHWGQEPPEGFLYAQNCLRQVDKV